MFETKKQYIVAIKNFKGMVNTPSRTFLADDEFFWIQNLVPTPYGNLKTIKDVVPLVTLPSAVKKMYCLEISSGSYLICFCQDGSIYSISGSTATKISDEYVFTNPDFVQWKDVRLLIIDPSIGYFTWNGTTFDQIDATIKGTTIAIWQERVWIGNGRTLLTSAPDAYNQFGADQGGGINVIKYPELGRSITKIVPFQTICYVIGDGGILFVTQPFLTEEGTLFYYIYPLQGFSGTQYALSVASKDDGVFFYSKAGIMKLVGNVRNLLSTPIAQVFSSIEPDAVNPIGCIFFYEGFEFYALLVKAKNLAQGSSEKYLLVYDDIFSRWFTIKFSIDLDYIIYNPYLFKFYGASGSSIYTLLDPASTIAPQSQIMTKAFDFNDPTIDKFLIRLGFYVYFPENLVFDVYVDAEKTSRKQVVFPQSYVSWINDQGQSVDWINESEVVVYWVGTATEVQDFIEMEGAGKSIGLSIYSDDEFYLNSIICQFREGARF